MKPVDLTVTVEQPLAAAQEQVLAAVDSRLSSAGYKQHVNGTTVAYTPKFVGMIIVWTVRRLRNDQVTLTFSEHGSATEVRATGQLRDTAHDELVETLGRL